ncbi:hypothetical protein LIER_11949 [Lithospermum erythrorhizon]|uniref:Uncharacterized protein n=1 Tax=Lithospermum erythrorhizon TaxID=34254 RepID=A0AAV3PV28_LITER
MPCRPASLEEDLSGRRQTGDGRPRSRPYQHRRGQGGARRNADEFVLMEIVELEEWLFRAVESGAELCVRGTGIGLENRMRYEGGANNWVVKC